MTSNHVLHYLTNNGSNLGDSHASGDTFVSIYNYVWREKITHELNNKIKKKSIVYTKKKNGCIARKLAQQMLGIPLPGTFAA
jgi:hypothetical protein